MIRRLLLSVSLCALAAPAVGASDLFKGGHAKYFFQLNTFPDDSLFRDIIDSPSVDHFGDLRLKFGLQKNSAKLVADYQLLAGKGDNGGDAWVTADRLRARGVACTVLAVEGLDAGKSLADPSCREKGGHIGVSLFQRSAPVVKPHSKGPHVLPQLVKTHRMATAQRQRQERRRGLTQMNADNRYRLSAPIRGSSIFRGLPIAKAVEHAV